jgi:hypothetical protein
VRNRSRWRTPAWYARPAPRIHFQHQLAACGLRVWTIRSPRRCRGGYTVAVRLCVADIPEQTITIAFGPAAPGAPHVYTDVPAASPHRYNDGSLCMWRLDDPPERRWKRRDGPVALLGHIVAHLLREEWWRQTGEWPGHEAPHPRANTSPNDPEQQTAA